MTPQERRQALAQYDAQSILDTNSVLFLGAFDDYDGIFTKRASEMTSEELAHAASDTNTISLLQALGYKPVKRKRGMV